MDQSIQRHDDVLQREASAQECIFYDSILVTLNCKGMTIAKEWQWQRCGCQRLGRSEVAFEKGEVVQRRGDAVGGGLVLLLQATAVCILQRAILFHANFKRPNHSNYISIETYLNGTMKWEDFFFFQRIPCCFLDGIWSSKTPLMFVKSTDCDKCPWSFLWQWPFWCLENKTSFTASVSLFVSFSFFFIHLFIYLSIYLFIY